ncbi:acetolactate synthase I/II/III large subunit [Microbacterium album]|uniref:Acetolactate synthase I/II/III large subunit n=1 Tax=Microbacterium album TaxID=2053191 RepID=A0A917IHW6_9MICO|nr:acetolactate synthase I/II/III large subunit [Microbacterium album]
MLGSGNFLFTDDFARHHGGRFVWVRHEASAVAAAAAYAQITGNLGVATVHQGPGVTNTLTTLTHAVRERQPVLVLAGETGRGLNVNQTIDLPRFAAAAGARVERVLLAESAIDTIARAARTALRDRIPVVVGIPTDVQNQRIEWHDPVAPPTPNAPRAVASPGDIAAVADLIEGSRRPLILAGRGAVQSGARPALEALGERIGALYATSLVANGLFAGNEYSVGVCGGFGSTLVPRVVPHADLIISFGATINQWTAFHGELIERSKVVQVDVDAAGIGQYGAARYGLVGDAAETAAALLAELERRGFSSDGFRGTELAEQVRSYDAAAEVEPAAVEGLIDPRSLCIALDEALPAERTVTYDSGHHHWWPTPFLSVPDATGFLAAQGFQSVGVALGSAIGMAEARPDRIAVVLIGDGGTLMQLGELDSLVAHGRRVVVVIFNDGIYGAEVHHFEPLGHGTEHVEFGVRDFAGVARALGATAAVVRSPEDVAQAIGEWLPNASGPLVLDSRVDPAVRSERLQEAFRQH